MPKKDPTQKFHLRIYDNFHYGDESEAYDYGEYQTYKEAIKGAEAIVDEFLKHNWKLGVTPGDLSMQFSFYGEDPVIFPNEPGEGNQGFSARKYVETAVEEVCKNFESNLSASEIKLHEAIKVENAKKQLADHARLASNYLPVERIIATRSSNKNYPIEKPHRIEILLTFTIAEFEKIEKGFIPQAQEEKWFIFYEDEWLFFHRAGTGYEIYRANIRKDKSGYLITEFWVETKSDKYESNNDDNERNILKSLIANLLLSDY